MVNYVVCELHFNIFFKNIIDHIYKIKKKMYVINYCLKGFTKI